MRLCTFNGERDVEIISHLFWPLFTDFLLVSGSSLRICYCFLRLYMGWHHNSSLSCHPLTSVKAMWSNVEAKNPMIRSLSCSCSQSVKYLLILERPGQLRTFNPRFKLTSVMWPLLQVNLDNYPVPIYCLIV